MRLASTMNPLLRDAILEVFRTEEFCSTTIYSIKLSSRATEAIRRPSTLGIKLSFYLPSTRTSIAHASPTSSSLPSSSQSIFPTMLRCNASMLPCLTTRMRTSTSWTTRVLISLHRTSTSSTRLGLKKRIRIQSLARSLLLTSRRSSLKGRRSSNRGWSLNSFPKCLKSSWKRWKRLNPSCRARSENI